MLVRLIRDPGARSWICDVSNVDMADLAIVGALARLQLRCKRSGSSLLLRHVNGDLSRLIDLVGLGEVLKEEER